MRIVDILGWSFEGSFTKGRCTLYNLSAKRTTHLWLSRTKRKNALAFWNTYWNLKTIVAQPKFIYQNCTYDTKLLYYKINSSKSVHLVVRYQKRNWRSLAFAYHSSKLGCTLYYSVALKIKFLTCDQATLSKRETRTTRKGFVWVEKTEAIAGCFLMFGRAKRGPKVVVAILLNSAGWSVE